MAIDPDEAVAYGAAIQGSILLGAHGLNENLVLVDVCPFTLGIAMSGGVFNQIIEWNSPIPIQKSEIFSTTTNDQQSVLIEVYQGENELVKENTLLSSFKLSGIPVAACGVPQIEVVFTLDMNGILVVSAHDKDSGNSESIIIMSETSQLNTSEINRMAQDAQEFAAQDKACKEQLRALNQLQQMAEWAESLGALVSMEELQL
ncbi:ATPase with role in protein import into the ER [Ceratobasidium sp. 423]|nr:ATPase with role in protein import into the ER [Ceratobasidium sp. 423]